MILKKRIKTCEYIFISRYIPEISKLVKNRNFGPDSFTDNYSFFCFTRTWSFGWSSIPLPLSRNTRRGLLSKKKLVKDRSAKEEEKKKKKKEEDETRKNSCRISRVSLGWW